MRIDKNMPDSIYNVIAKSFFHYGLMALLLFFALSWMVISGYTMVVDNFVVNFIYPLRTQQINSLFITLTSLMNWEMVTAYFILLLLYHKTRRVWGIRLSIYIAVTTLIQRGLKLFIQRPRPDTQYSLIYESSFSFPSGHAITAMVLFGYVFSVLLISLWTSGQILCITPKNLWKTELSLWKKLLILFFPFGIFSIGFSRIYLGVHFFTDVLGAWLLGICLVCMFISFDLKHPGKNSPIFFISKTFQHNYPLQNDRKKRKPSEIFR